MSGGRPVAAEKRKSDAIASAVRTGVTKAVSDQASQAHTAGRDRVAANRLLARVAWHGGPWLGLLVATALALAATETVLPAVLGRGLDAVVGRAPKSWLTWCGLVIALLVVFDVLDDLAAGAATAESTAWLRHTTLHHILDLGTRAQRRFTPGEVASRLTGNAAEAGRVPDMVRALANVVPAVGGTVALALIDPWLCLTFLVGVPVLVLVVRAFARDASDRAERYLEVQGTIAARLVDALAGARTIAAAGTADREAERVLAPLPDLHEAGLGMWRAQITVAVQHAVVVALLEIAVLAVAGAELARGRITAGEMLAAGQYVLLAATLGAAVASVTRLARARAGAGRTAEILGEAPVPYGTARLPKGGGQIEFRGVKVRPGGRPILDGIDLVIPPGAMVAVVGRSGSGKSVLAALAGRLVDPDEGEVLLDGIPQTQLSRRELRREVAYGFDRPMLIGETVTDVIAFGERRPTFDEVVDAACLARADGFIRRMPRGYHTRLAEAPLSGGEVQRVGLARAFAHAGRVVVLDDVAASLDTVTEHHISGVLTGELVDRTRLVVAHRASTAARADLVVWLDDGRVRQVAPHRRLWSGKGYRALFEPDGPPGPQVAIDAALNGGP
jgi:ATP-binding cassette subfamily B protein